MALMLTHLRPSYRSADSALHIIIYVSNRASRPSLTNRQVFADMGSDGMTIDDRGNIYLTGDGVTVFDKDGQKIAHFPIPEDWTANVCFGGKERNVLFITASKSVYILKMLVYGVK